MARKSYAAGVRLAAAVALMVCALLASGGTAAQASHVETSCGPEYLVYHGSDGAGTIAFTVGFDTNKCKIGSPFELEAVSFANRCVAGGSTVPARIEPARQNAYRYSYAGQGVTVNVTVDKSDPNKASGTVSALTSKGCDSGTLSFTATGKSSG